MPFIMHSESLEENEKVVKNITAAGMNESQMSNDHLVEVQDHDSR